MTAGGTYELVPPEETSSVPDSKAFRPFVLDFKAFFRLSKTVAAAFTLVLTANLVWFFFPSHMTNAVRDSDGAPLAKTVNGIYRGTYLADYNQDVFLGMQYAATPVGFRRFRVPQPLDASWEDKKEAVRYGPQCMGYGAYNRKYNMSEDCLTINVVRPAHYERQSLPVGVFIYGGGRFGSGTSNERYNMTFLVSHAAKIGLPFIRVSFNYRSSIWGFLTSDEVFGTGNSNIGLHDQRFALRWVQTNIAGFGGDPQKVTIWGGSSGADNVGLHLTAYGGKDEGLFRAAILQSGSAATRTSYQGIVSQELYNKLITKAGCNGTEASLECLRELSFSQVNFAFNDSAEAGSPMMLRFGLPVMDGELLRHFGSLNLKASKIAKVPIISGVVLNEGSTWIPHNVSNWEEFRVYLIDKLLSFYPESMPQSDELFDPPLGSIMERRIFDRIEKVLGDLEINAAQSLACQASSRIATCYSYLFSAMPPRRIDSRLGVTHGAEIGPLFQNFEGLGLEQNPFEDKGESFYNMASLMGTMWAGFIHSLDPNIGLRDPRLLWPKYSIDNPKRFVFREGMLRWEATESDYRSNALKYINSIQHSIFNK
ncbi:MAG: hypothetical protein M1818_003635 [Claussenomyces sp. TS43310]|nr:MAG: hypothetical protein M1818_003635 [Claussenomyces sp. TS43310]